MSNIQALRLIASGIRQLSAAAASAQIQMQQQRIQDKNGRRKVKVTLTEAEEMAPLEALDRLARHLAEPYLAALDKLERTLDGEGM